MLFSSTGHEVEMCVLAYREGGGVCVVFYRMQNSLCCVGQRGIRRNNWCVLLDSVQNSCDL